FAIKCFFAHIFIYQRSTFGLAHCVEPGSKYPWVKGTCPVLQKIEQRGSVDHYRASRIGDAIVVAAVASVGSQFVGQEHERAKRQKMQQWLFENVGHIELTLKISGCTCTACTCRQKRRAKQRNEYRETADKGKRRQAFKPSWLRCRLRDQ